MRPPEKIKMIDLQTSFRSLERAILHSSDAANLQVLLGRIKDTGAEFKFR
jgi:hypothetical protein